MDKKEIAIEGENRISDFRCYKSHHQLAELGLAPEEISKNVIYVLRDPRDVAISGSHHFMFHPSRRLARFFRGARRIERIYQRTLYPLEATRDYRLERMTSALLEGCGAVHNWVRVSWREHWRPYQMAGVPMVRYEDLLAQPETEGERILHHLGLERTRAEIASAVQNQSFGRKKETLLASGETGRAKFLRVGKSGQWREQLPVSLQQRFAEELGTELAEWRYALTE